ncbi:uncharacterized protein LY89DRAFT_88484 [Mollisia scopiformis]|uniref:Uncharacterized protein n=1 Tax=Mollisia scopiformis TaxID=149040 RepID=A0A194X8Y2_MOLSC|nr:uncharacterized protein LY89DRAFT_88484 [Mollisia scopiformis]KUJ16628.1 hypothetical protein LY89DRAFT_88484 [Mollisia scopiformis]
MAGKSQRSRPSLGNSGPSRRAVNRDSTGDEEAEESSGSDSNGGDQGKEKRVKSKQSAPKSGPRTPTPADDTDSDTDGEWSREDKIVLDKTLKEEVRVWDRTLDLWDMTPPESLPPELHVELGDRTIDDPWNAGQTFRNTNWSKKFSVAFADVVLCPVFQENIPLWHCAIRMSMQYRLADKYEGRVADYLRLTGKRNDRVLSLFKPLLSKDTLDYPRIDSKLRRRIDSEIGKDVAPDSEFLSHLKAAVDAQRKFHEEENGIMPRDLKAISDAWDSYVRSSPGLR